MAWQGHLKPESAKDHLQPSADQPEASAQTEQANGPPGSPEVILRLQRTIGNRAVGAMLAGEAAPPRPSAAPPTLQRVITGKWENYNLDSLKREQKRRDQGGRIRPKSPNKYQRLTAGELKLLIVFRSHGSLGVIVGPQPQNANLQAPAPAHPFAQAQPPQQDNPHPAVIEEESDDSDGEQEAEIEEPPGLQDAEAEEFFGNPDKQEAEETPDEQHAAPPQAQQPQQQDPSENLTRFMSISPMLGQLSCFFLQVGQGLTALSEKFPYSLDSHSEEKMATPLMNAIRLHKPSAVYVFSTYSPCSNYTPPGTHAFHNCSKTLSLLPSIVGVPCFLAYWYVWEGQENYKAHEREAIKSESLKGLENLRGAGWIVKRL